jgi:hypothetical protein
MQCPSPLCLVEPIMELIFIEFRKKDDVEKNQSRGVSTSLLHTNCWMDEREDRLGSFPHRGNRTGVYAG